MTNKLKYLFLLPAYKARYFNDALKSIQAQTYKDFKVLISDDCSPEDLRTICKPYLEDYRFEYRRNDRNIGGNEGLVAHWNMLLEKYDAEYVIMTSDDDVYNTKFLEEVDDFVNKYTEVNLFRTRVCVIDDNGVINEDDYFSEYSRQIDFLKEMFCTNHSNCIGNYVFRKSYLDKIGRFVDYPAAWYTDNIATILCANNGVVNIPNILFTWRWSDINISSYAGNKNRNKKNDKPKVDASIKFITWIKDYLPNVRLENNYDKIIYERIETNALNYSYRNIVNYIESLNFKEFIYVYKFLKSNNLLVGLLSKLRFILSWLKSFVY